MVLGVPILKHFKVFNFWPDNLIAPCKAALYKTVIFLSCIPFDLPHLIFKVEFDIK